MTRKLLLIVLAVALAPVAARASPASPRAAAPISGATPFADDCGAPGAMFGTEVEPQVAVNPLDGLNMIAAWQQDRYPDGGSRGDVLAFTRDGGATWQRVLVPGISECTGGLLERATDPWVAFGPEGRAYFLAEALNGEEGPDMLMVATSIDGGATWSKPFEVTHDVGAISDKGALTPDPLHPGTAYLTFLRTGNSGWFTRTIDGGATWLPALPITLTGQGHIVSVLADGTLVIVANDGGRIRSIRSTDQGLTWSLPVTIGTASRSNPNVRQIRDFNLPSIAVTGSTAHVVWENGNAISYARSAGGATWSTPAAITNASILAFTPTIAVTSGGALGVSFYDLRSDTAASTLLADLWLRVSHDNGATWSEQRISGPFDLTRAPFAGGYFVGDYTGLGTSGENFVPVFARPTPSGSGVATDIYMGVAAS